MNLLAFSLIGTGALAGYLVPKPTLWRLPQGFATAKGDPVFSEYLDD